MVVVVSMIEFAAPPLTTMPFKSWRGSKPQQVELCYVAVQELRGSYGSATDAECFKLP